MKQILKGFENYFKDCSVRFYDVTTNQLRQKYMHDCPVLDVTFQDSIHTISAGLDNQVKLKDLNSHTESILGTHEGKIWFLEHILRKIRINLD